MEGAGVGRPSRSLEHLGAKTASGTRDSHRGPGEDSYRVMGVDRQSRSELLTHKQCPVPARIQSPGNVPLVPLCPLQPFLLLNLAQFRPGGERDRNLAKYFNRMYWQLLHGFLDLHTSDLVAVETMALSVMCLGLALLGVLQSQAQDSTQNLIPAPSLLTVPLQPDFRSDQFRGRWYVVGLAGNAVQKKTEGSFTMYSTIYELQENNSYNVTSILVRDQDQGCRYWIRTFVPSSRAGQFTLGNMHRYPQVQSYNVQVATTDYNQFAMVFFRKTSENKQYFKITLYGRTKELSPELKERFTRFAKSLGLKDDNIIFSVPTDQCIDN